MKKIYLLALLLSTTAWAQAQISGCNDPSGGIQIAFDKSMNCAAAPGDLAGMSEVGFHSGANTWASVVDWNAGTALTAVNDGSDVFTVYIPDPDVYYATTVDNIYFVFNQGPTTPDTPWDSEGKMDDGAGGCADFSIVLADITEACAMTLSSDDLELQNEITIAPNPFSDKATISLDNPNAETFQITVTTLTGQLVKAESNFSGTSYELTRANMSAGLYFVTFQNAAGQSATQKVIVQ